MNYNLKYLKYKQKYINQKTKIGGSKKNIGRNIKNLIIKEYFSNLEKYNIDKRCFYNFDMKNIIQLEGANDSSSGAYILMGELNSFKINFILNILLNLLQSNYNFNEIKKNLSLHVVIKIFLIDCRYQYLFNENGSIRKSRINFKFQFSTEIGTLKLLSEHILEKKFTPNIVMYFSGGGCLTGFKTEDNNSKCDINKEFTQFDNFIIDSNSNNILGLIYKKYTKINSINKENYISNNDYDDNIFYVIAEKCRGSIRSYINDIIEQYINPNTNYKFKTIEIYYNLINSIISIVSQLIITFKILHKYFNTNDYIFSHGDLHPGNILYIIDRYEKFICYEINDEIYYVKTNNIIIKIWDVDTTNVYKLVKKSDEQYKKYYGYIPEIMEPNIERIDGGEQTIDMFIFFDQFFNGCLLKTNEFSYGIKDLPYIENILPIYKNIENIIKIAKEQKESPFSINSNKLDKYEEDFKSILNLSKIKPDDNDITNYYKYSNEKFNEI
jgi:hypothetical protein